MSVTPVTDLCDVDTRKDVPGCDTPRHAIAALLDAA